MCQFGNIFSIPIVEIHVIQKTKAPCFNCLKIGALLYPVILNPLEKVKHNEISDYLFQKTTKSNNLYNEQHYGKFGSSLSNFDQ